jgi:hypothetical protein
MDVRSHDVQRPSFHDFAITAFAAVSAHVAVPATCPVGRQHHFRFVDLVTCPEYYSIALAGRGQLGKLQSREDKWISHMSHANDRGIDADIMHRKPTGILLLSDA